MFAVPMKGSVVTPDRDCAHLNSGGCPRYKSVPGAGLSGSTQTEADISFSLRCRRDAERSPGMEAVPAAPKPPGWGRFFAVAVSRLALSRPLLHSLFLLRLYPDRVFNGGLGCVYCHF